MSWRHDYYPRYTPSSRRQAENGIKARSQSGAIGVTWWSKRFIETLERYTESKRLTRGRSYARSGQVMKLELKTGLATAKVQGSRAQPYAVQISVDPFTAESWEAIEKKLASEALLCAKLLAGEIPHEMEGFLQAQGLSLFPGGRSELRTSCSCPDSANPCKHLAATYYILGEKFDEDPFLMLLWRGRAREDLLRNLRALRGAEEQGSSPQGSVHMETSTSPLSKEMAHFHDMGDLGERRGSSPRKAEFPDGLLRRLGPMPKGTGIADPYAVFATAVAWVSEAAERRAHGGLDGE